MTAYSGGWACVLVLAAVAISCGLARGAEGDWPPHRPLIPMQDILSVARQMEPGEFGHVQVLQDAPDGPVIRATVTTRPDRFWQFSVRALAPELRQRDVLLLRFRARVVESFDEDSEGIVNAYFEQSSPDWDKSFESAVRVGPQWREYTFPFRSRANYAAGESHLVLAFGSRRQVVEIADVQLLHFGQDVALDALPRTPLTYPGMEADAPWRAQAAERIERHRKGDLEIVVQDADGQPVDGAQVQVRMRRHAFAFGSTVVPRTIARQDDENAEIYRTKILELFNHVSTENALKWHRWEQSGADPQTRAAVMAGLDWLRDHDIPVHGHVLVWPGWRNLPRDLRELEDDPDALRRRIDEHIVDILTATRQYTHEWDVVNEAWSNNDLMKILGDEIVAHWFELAKRTHPQARMYYNDYGILAAGGQTDTAQQAHYENLVRTLLEAGAPLEGLGMQGHFGENVTPPQTLLAILDRYARFALPIQITEFDISTTDRQLQAAYQRDFMTTIFSHPAVNGFVMWGFWEGHHWRPEAAMFTRDWQPRPHLQAYRDLVFGEWWTNADGATDQAGNYRVRGFLGDYEITVTAPDGAARTERTSLQAPGTRLTIRLP